MGDRQKKKHALFRVLILPVGGSIISCRNFHDKCYLEELFEARIFNNTECNIEAGIEQSVQRLATGCTTKGSEFESR
jgi:hypothetical protein